MVVLRCTQKLLRRLKVNPTSEPGRSTTALGDWFANPIGVARVQVVLCISERSRLPVVLPARDLANVGEHLRYSLSLILQALRVQPRSSETELEAMHEVSFASTNSRSHLASMNDFAYHLKWRLGQNPKADLLGVALELSQIPVGPLDYLSPDDVTRRLLA